MTTLPRMTQEDVERLVRERHGLGGEWHNIGLDLNAFGQESVYEARFVRRISGWVGPAFQDTPRGVLMTHEPTECEDEIICRGPFKNLADAWDVSSRERKEQGTS